MDLTAVFSKTIKGHEEISTRHNHLPFRMRAMLIMVDGRHTGAELVTQSVFGAEAEQHLAALLNGDFIAAQVPAAVAAAPANDKSKSRQADDDITLAKRYLVKNLHEMLGPEGDSFALHIEKATTAEELLQYLEKLREPLIVAAGKMKADEFWEKMSLVLDDRPIRPSPAPASR